MSACTSTAWDTSVLTKMASPPLSVIIWTVCCPPSSFISAMTSFAPSRANVRAVALPIPDAPPVTNATFPSTRPGIGISPLLHRFSGWIVCGQNGIDVVSRIPCWGGWLTPCLGHVLRRLHPLVLADVAGTVPIDFRHLHPDKVYGSIVHVTGRGHNREEEHRPWPLVL